MLEELKKWVSIANISEEQQIMLTSNDLFATVEYVCILTQREKEAEAKLAELEKQKPIGRVDRGEVTENNEYPDARVVCLHDQAGWENFQDGTELFTRPAPAINLADLVPPETSCIGWVRDEIKEHDKKWIEMLRNIEEPQNGKF